MRKLRPWLGVRFFRVTELILYQCFIPRESPPTCPVQGTGSTVERGPHHHSRSRSTQPITSCVLSIPCSRLSLALAWLLILPKLPPSTFLASNSLKTTVGVTVSQPNLSFSLSLFRNPQWPEKWPPCPAGPSVCPWSHREPTPPPHSFCSSHTDLLPILQTHHIPPASGLFQTLLRLWKVLVPCLGSLSGVALRPPSGKAPLGLNPGWGSCFPCFFLLPHISQYNPVLISVMDWTNLFPQKRRIKSGWFQCCCCCFFPTSTYQCQTPDTHQWLCSCMTRTVVKMLKCFCVLLVINYYRSPRCPMVHPPTYPPPWIIQVTP